MVNGLFISHKREKCTVLWNFFKLILHLIQADLMTGSIHLRQLRIIRMGKKCLMTNYSHLNVYYMHA
jgi:hypothetical protein